MILLIGGTWALHNREQSEMIVQYLIAAAGFFGVFLPDSLGNYLGNKINSMDQPLPPIDLVGRSEPIRASSEPVRVAETQEQVPEYIQHVPSHGSISVLNMPVEETFTHTEADISTDSRDSAETGWGDK